MRNRHGEDFAFVDLGQPWRIVVDHADAGDARLVAANGVERQRRGLGTWLGDGSARNKAQLDETCAHGLRNLSVHGVEDGRTDGGALFFEEELNALCRGVRALVELAGQRLDGEDGLAVQAGLLERDVRVVDLRLCEHEVHGDGELGVGRALHVVAIEHAHRYSVLRRECSCVAALPIFHVHTLNHRAPDSL